MNKQLKIFSGVVVIALAILIMVGLSNRNNTTPTPTTKTEAEQNQTLPVTLSIEHPKAPKTYTITVQEGATAMAVTEKASQQYDFQLGVKEYSFGKLVESIDGVSADQSANQYWTLYINGQMSNVGASDYKVKSGDTVSWKYGG